jgi:hypothetical protein
MFGCRTNKSRRKKIKKYILKDKFKKKSVDLVLLKRLKKVIIK